GVVLRAAVPCHRRHQVDRGEVSRPRGFHDPLGRGAAARRVQGAAPLVRPRSDAGVQSGLDNHVIPAKSGNPEQRAGSVALGPRFRGGDGMGDRTMKFGLFYEHQLPQPWGEESELRLYQQALDQIELADRLGIDYVWEVEHHFLEEYSHSSAPEVFLAACSQRTKRIRLGHGITL